MGITFGSFSSPLVWWYIVYKSFGDDGFILFLCDPLLTVNDLVNHQLFDVYDSPELLTMASNAHPGLHIKQQDDDILAWAGRHSPNVQHVRTQITPCVCGTSATKVMRGTCHI